MKIAVMGAGGVGGYFGGLLAKAGNDVLLVARGQHAQAIQEKGLRVESAASGDFTVHPLVAPAPRRRLAAGPSPLRRQRYSTPEAIETIRPMVGGHTTVLTLQNGVANGEHLANAFGEERVLLGAAYIETHLKEPGVVHQTGGPCRILFGEVDGSRTPRAEAVLLALQQAEITVQISDNILKELWNKFIFICALSGMASIARASLGEVMASPETRDLLVRVMREAETVGRARGVGLDVDVVEQTVAHFDEFSDELRSSMQLDLERGNRLEVEALNGTVARFGRETGIETPVNDFIHSCLKLADDRARLRASP